MTLFSIYKDQYNSVKLRNEKLIESISFKKVLDKEENIFLNIQSEIEKNFREMERIIKQMELDLNLSGGINNYNKFPVNQGREDKMNIIRISKNEFEKLKIKFKKEKENFSNKNKKEETINLDILPLNKNCQKNVEKTYSSHLDPLLNEEITILNITDNSNHKLHSALRTTIELEKSSENIKRELLKQTDDLTLMNNKVSNINSSIDSSKRIITSMISSGNRNKYLLSVFSVTMVFMLILIIYSKY
jgi:predicted RND superfamily exporter protein